MPVRISVYPSFQPDLDALARDRETHVRQTHSGRSQRPRHDPSTRAPGSYRNIQGDGGGAGRQHNNPERSQSSGRSHPRDGSAPASRSRSVASRAQPPLQQSASAAQPVPMIARTPSNKSDLRRSSTQTPSRTPSYQQVPVIPRASSGSHPSVHQVFQHPSPPGSQVHMYAPQTPGHAYGHGHQQNAPRHAHSPPQSTPPSATPSRATSPRAVHRKSPPAYHSQPQQNMSALSLHSAGSLTGHGQAQPSPSIQASLASGSASSSALSPTSSGVVSLLPGSTSATQLPQARSRPDVSSTSGHGHERLQEEAQIAESRIPPHPPQSVLSEDDHRLSRMALLQPRLPQTQPMTQMAEHEPIMKEAEASPPPTHGLDVPQGVDVDGDRTPSPAPAQSQSQSHHAALAPVQGKPRIFATVNTDEVADEPRPEQATSKLSPEWDYEDGQRVQEPEASLVRGKPRILAAQADGDTGLEAVGREKAEPAQPDILYTQHTGAYSQPADAYTEPRHLEEELEQEATGIVRDYPHTHGYPTPRSRSPVLLVDRVPTDSARGREEQRSGPREGDMEGRRVSRSLPPTPSPRAPSPEPHPDTDVERADGNDRRRLKKLRKVIGSSQSDEEGEDRRRGHHFGLRKGLGIFGFKTLTERQVGKLGTRDAAAPLETQGGASASGSMPIATVQRSASESDGRRKLRKDSRRGRREDRSEEGTNQREHEQDINEDSGFVHVDASEIQEEMQRGRTGPWAPPTPVTPEDYARARAQRRGTKLSKPLPALNVQTQAPLEPQEPPKPSQPYPLVRHLLEPTMLAGLLTYLTYSEWLGMARLCRAVREGVAKDRELTECVLEQFLGAVGYSRWMWGLDPSAAKEKSRERSGERQERMKPAGEAEPMVLTLQDLNAYMRGVSMPSHQYGNLASEYLRARGDPHQLALMGELAACCRAYTRIVLRLRAQAEAEARFAPPVTASSPTAPNFPPAHRTPSLARGSSRGSSRAPSVSVSHAASTQAPVRAAQSPLFRLRRAPLLQVFVPSPGGDWLSDDSVLACEEELNKAGAIRLMRAGDVVWDVAVGDEGNIGRMVWDGSYLIDLDYAWSRIGDLPRYLPTLAFPPSYFHRVIRTQGSGNPICHIDIAPWGGEIASNLQLLQDRMKTETPQGSHHTVVRWVHRSSFTVIPSTPNKPIRIPPMPNVGPGPNHGVWYVDPGWYGRIVVEAEGTNEGVADLQMRCRGAFPPRAVGARPGGERGAHAGNNVFRILRERSRPGEIWIRTVRDKERLVPR